MNRYTVTAQEMRQIEQAAFNQGVPPVLVMENAARALCDALHKMAKSLPRKRALFLCGPGNNGGDGLAAARLYALSGGQSLIYLPITSKTKNAKENEHYLRYLGIRITDTLPHPDDVDIIVDALLGIGQTRAPEGAIADAVHWANKSGLPILSVDIPTGMDSDDGRVYEPCIRASATVTFHAIKRGLLLSGKRGYAGECTVAPIGLRTAPIGVPYYEDNALSLMPPRDVNSHKGTCGRVLIYAGSMGKAGAAAMCAMGALKAGAGLVTILCPAVVIPVLQTLVPNAMCSTPDQADSIAFDVLCAGCGIGTTEEAWRTLSHLVARTRNENKKCVLDADALNLLSQQPMMLPEDTVITPHPLECARLIGCSLDDVLATPLESARFLSGKYSCTVILKNAVSVIARQDQLALSAAGSPALAKGGSGDALAGILSATLWEMQDPFESARLACLRMGKAARDAENTLGVRGMLTQEMLSFLR